VRMESGLRKFHYASALSTIVRNARLPDRERLGARTRRALRRDTGQRASTNLWLHHHCEPSALTASLVRTLQIEGQSVYLGSAFVGVASADVPFGALVRRVAEGYSCVRPGALRSREPAGRGAEVVGAGSAASLVDYALARGEPAPRDPLRPSRPRGHARSRTSRRGHTLGITLMLAA
jgi:hypothetical protein